MSDWFSVEERRPQEGQRVIAYWGKLGGSIEEARYEWGNFRVDGNPTNSPTHWMPFPAPPLQK